MKTESCTSRRPLWLTPSLVVACLFVMGAAFGCAKTVGSLATPQASSTLGQAGARAVIRSGSLRLRAKELNPIKVEVERLIQDLDGWVESWSLSDDKWLEMSVRVPEAKLDSTMDQMATWGKVVSRSLSSRDVTEQLIDLDARLTNLLALRDRLRAYLDRAEDLKEILEVEKELVRVQSEIDALEAKLKILRGQVAMAALRLTVKRR